MFLNSLFIRKALFKIFERFSFFTLQFWLPDSVLKWEDAKKGDIIFFEENLEMIEKSAEETKIKVWDTESLCSVN